MIKQNQITNKNSWALAFATLMMILFSLFVILYAFEKAKKHSETNPKTDTVQKEQQSQNRESRSEGAQNILRTQKMLETKVEIQDFLNKTLEQEQFIEKNDFELVTEDDGLIVRLILKNFFISGKAEIPFELQRPVQKLLQVVLKSNHFVKIQGYVDAVETQRNWQRGFELSFRRAQWLLNYWMSLTDQLDPLRVSLEGMAYANPLSSENSSWGYAQNRRVEIIFYDKKSY